MRVSLKRRTALLGAAGLFVAAGAGPAVAQTPGPKPLVRKIATPPAGTRVAPPLHEGAFPPPGAVPFGTTKTGADWQREAAAAQAAEPKPGQARIAGKTVTLAPGAAVQGVANVNYLLAVQPDGSTKYVDPATLKPLPDQNVETTYQLVRQGDVLAFVGTRSKRLSHTRPPGREAEFAWLAAELAR